VTEQVAQQAVRRTVTVPLDPERAFALFAERMDAWWPASHSITDAPFETAVIEPRGGGRWYERAQDGTEADWGRVLEYDPPRRLVLGWQLQADYSYDPDPARGSEIEVRFTVAGEGSTRVDLEHRHFERHGHGADEVRRSVGSENGWAGLLAGYAAAA
jgi:uncharacterized protein YndB with AHSA1/START domain